jgi:hypothetical protein
MRGDALTIKVIREYVGGPKKDRWVGVGSLTLKHARHGYVWPAGYP